MPLQPYDQDQLDFLEDQFAKGFPPTAAQGKALIATVREATTLFQTSEAAAANARADLTAIVEDLSRDPTWANIQPTLHRLQALIDQSAPEKLPRTL